jgi:hypothetical protein
MSGSNLLLNTAIDYERTHQIALYTLLTKSQFPKIWLGILSECQVLWEPERQLFDIMASDSNKQVYIELKMWSSLGDDQFKRQVDFLAKNHSNAVYVLLGTSWFEYTPDKISELSKGFANKHGYEELLKALNSLLVQPDQSPDVYELTLAYRNSLQAQFNNLTDAALNSSERNRLFYYSLFWMLKQRLPTLETAIYTVNNPGGPVYILNNSAWLDVSIKGAAVQLYSEVVNDRLCIKFFTEADNDKKLEIRGRLREAVHSVLDKHYTVLDSGRLGAYMTACQIDWDFSDTSKLDDSARVFSDIHNRLVRIADQL